MSGKKEQKLRKNMKKKQKNEILKHLKKNIVHISFGNPKSTVGGKSKTLEKTQWMIAKKEKLQTP